MKGYKILRKKTLAENVILMDILAPRIAQAAQPGQFLIVRANEQAERIPLTICDYDVNKGTISIVTQVVGVSTKIICQYNEGDELLNVAGPLGNPSEFIHQSQSELKNTNILFVAGGIGTAPIYPQVKWLHEKGITTHAILGARSKAHHILLSEMETVTDNLYLTTDDGSLGSKGLVTEQIVKLVEEGKKIDHIVAIGPMIMMKFVTLTAKKYNIPTTVSLNSIMIDGTGMCGACRVSVDGKIKFTCVDGPEFDAYKVDFDEALVRQKIYHNQERHANCQCF